MDFSKSLLINTGNVENINLNLKYLDNRSTRLDENIKEDSYEKNALGSKNNNKYFNTLNSNDGIGRYADNSI